MRDDQNENTSVMKKYREIVEKLGIEDDGLYKLFAESASKSAKNGMLEEYLEIASTIERRFILKNFMEVVKGINDRDALKSFLKGVKKSNNENLLEDYIETAKRIVEEIKNDFVLLGFSAYVNDWDPYDAWDLETAMDAFSASLSDIKEIVGRFEDGNYAIPLFAGGLCGSIIYGVLGEYLEVAKRLKNRVAFVTFVNEIYEGVINRENLFKLFDEEKIEEFLDAYYRNAEMISDISDKIDGIDGQIIFNNYVTLWAHYLPDEITRYLWIFNKNLRKIKRVLKRIKYDKNAERNLFFHSLRMIEGDLIDQYMEIMGRIKNDDVLLAFVLQNLPKGKEAKRYLEEVKKNIAMVEDLTKEISNRYVLISTAFGLFRALPEDYSFYSVYRKNINKIEKIADALGYAAIPQFIDGAIWSAKNGNIEEMLDLYEQNLDRIKKISEKLEIGMVKYLIFGITYTSLDRNIFEKLMGAAERIKDRETLERFVEGIYRAYNAGMLKEYLEKVYSLKGKALKEYLGVGRGRCCSCMV